jgi:sugar lactone lactonase YvrE
VVTVAGAGGVVNGFEDGDGAEARFAGQEGIALSADGKILYVADGNGGAEDEDELSFHRIRRVHLP